MLAYKNSDQPGDCKKKKKKKLVGIIFLDHRRTRLKKKLKPF
jgi:hypothetical protein